jgi:hypothetical protein
MGQRIDWPARWLNLRAAVLTLATGRHHYVATGCIHGNHAHCRSTVSATGGGKNPGTCKFCPATCECGRCNHSRTS